MTDTETEQREYRQFRFERPPGATELLLVRHGESEPSRDDRPMPLVGGHGDPALAPEGEEQAQRVGARLALEGVDAIYVSTLRRTHQTAAPLLARLGLEATVEPDFREVYLGEWEGTFRQKVAAADPIALRMWEEQRWDVIPGAEPADDFARRVRGAVERLAAVHPDQRVAVFTHGGVIGQVLADASGSRAFAFTGADNGSISHLVVDGARWIVRRYNDTAHLSPDFTLRPTPLT
jgi:probable phosphoglycerate mutase